MDLGSTQPGGADARIFRNQMWVYPELMVRVRRMSRPDIICEVKTEGTPAALDLLRRPKLVSSGKNTLSQSALVDCWLAFLDAAWLYSLLRGYLEVGVSDYRRYLCLFLCLFNLYDSYFVFRGFYSLSVKQGWGSSGSWVFMKISKSYAY